MATNNYTIRLMNRAELDIAMDWAEQEGWNPGLHDADHFYCTNANGLFIGLLNGEPIGCISAVAYGETFGFIGLYIVRPAFRKRGFGLPLFHTAIARLKGMNVAPIGLEGALAQQKNYEKSGFRIAYRTLRYQGTGIGDGLVPDTVVELKTIQLPQLEDYDASCFLTPRGDFLRHWIRQEQGAAFAAMDNGRLAGYGVIRACRKTGYRIGPLFSDTPSIADKILRALLGHAPKGSPVFVDMPEINANGISLANELAMRFVLENARMYHGVPPPRSSMDKVFGITTLELG